MRGSSCKIPTSRKGREKWGTLPRTVQRSDQRGYIRKGNQVRNLIYAINVTLDGCCDHTKQAADDELLDHYTLLLRDVDLFVYGRKTYQLMVPYWPDVAKDPSATKADKEFARTFVSKKKI